MRLTHRILPHSRVFIQKAICGLTVRLLGSFFIIISHIQHYVTAISISMVVSVIVVVIVYFVLIFLLLLHLLVTFQIDLNERIVQIE